MWSLLSFPPALMSYKSKALFCHKTLGEAVGLWNKSMPFKPPSCVHYIAHLLSPRKLEGGESTILLPHMESPNSPMFNFLIVTQDFFYVWNSCTNSFKCSTELIFRMPAKFPLSFRCNFKTQNQWSTSGFIWMIRFRAVAIFENNKDLLQP